MISRLIFLFALTMPLYSCSILTGEDGVFRDRKKDYKKAESTERIRVPEHLDDTAFIDHYAIPEPGPRAGRDMIDRIPLPSGIQTEQQDKVRLQTLGERQWVLVQLPPSEVWPRLRTFINTRPVQLLSESGSVGIMQTVAEEGFYHFRVEQGLQRHSTELSIRFVVEQQSDQGVWPVASSDAEKEREMLMHAAQFMADISEHRIHSFAAQGIGTEPKLLEQEDELGFKSLLLRTDAARASASLGNALSRANFVTVDANDTEQNGFLVQFAPPWPQGQGKAPGFFRKLFGIRARPYDTSVAYAGNYYRFLINEQAGKQHITVQAVDADGRAEQRSQQELNAQIRRIRGALY